MRKLADREMIEDRGPRRRGAWPWVAAIMLLLALSPVLFEAGALCAARWRGMFGEQPYVATPALDQIGIWKDEAAHAAVRAIRPVFHDVPWKPEVVIAVGIGWAMLLGLLLLRR